MRIAAPFVVLAWLLATSSVLAAPLEGARDHDFIAKDADRRAVILEGRKTLPKKTTQVAPPATKPPTTIHTQVSKPATSKPVTPVTSKSVAHVSSAPVSAPSSVKSVPSSVSRVSSVVSVQQSSTSIVKSSQVVLSSSPSSISSSAAGISSISSISSGLNALSASVPVSIPLASSVSGATSASSLALASSASGTSSAVSASSVSASSVPSSVSSGSSTFASTSGSAASSVSASALSDSSSISIWSPSPSDSASFSASVSGSAVPSDVPGPSACPTPAQTSGATSIAPAPSSSTSIPAHPRAFAVAARASASSLPPCQDTASCKVRGQDLWDKVTAATADKDAAQTTAKYQASYQQLSQPQSIPTASGLGRQIFSLFARLKNSGVRLPPLQAPLLANMPATITQQIIPGKSEGSVAFENVYAPGVIVGVNNFRAEDPVAAANQVGWNVVACEQYKEFKGTAAPTDLQFIMRFHIDNSVTIAVLNDVYTTHQMAAQAAQDDIEWTKWAADDDCGMDVILSLLGTDNGKGAAFILIDYKATLGKNIVAIYTRRQEGQWAMVVEYA
ncbi:hypothetical protein B0H11DRAFT_2198100 [Mycena galericulata]|nr:hypothetical protein B0H11DRAFT_2198100 [Mycena galericulata]